MKRVLFVCTALLSAAPAAALELPEAVSQPSLYFSVGFGGARSSAPAPLRYGLRLDRAWQHDQDSLPPVVALEFTRAGFRDLLLGGLPLTATSVRLSQAEETGAATESPGLKFWKWGLPQWGMVIGAGAVAYAYGSYQDPTEADPKEEPAAESTACGDDVPQPVFGPSDCI